MSNRATILKEFLTFLAKNKMWYIIPVLMVLLVLGLLIVLTQGSAVAPFIYTMF